MESEVIFKIDQKETLPQIKEQTQPVLGPKPF